MTNRFDPVDFPDSFPNYEAFDNFSAERSVKNFSSGLGRGSGYLVIDWGRQSGVLQGTHVQRVPHKVGARILVTPQSPLRTGASVEAGRAGDSLDSPFTVTSLSPPRYLQSVARPIPSRRATSAFGIPSATH